MVLSFSPSSPFVHANIAAGTPFITEACRKSAFGIVQCIARYWGQNKSLISKDILRIEPESTIKQLVNTADAQNFTPLYYACEAGSLDIAYLLKENGAEPPVVAEGYANGQ